MAGAVAVVLALAPQEKPIQALVLPNRIEPITPPGKEFVNITLVTYVEDQLVFGRIENPVQCNGQLYHAQVRTEVSTGLRKNRDQLIAYLLSELWKSPFFKTLEVRGRTDGVQQPGS